MYLQIRKALKYRKDTYYDIIVYYQTNFQKLIIDYLIETRFTHKKILEIDVRNKRLKVNSFESFFFLNSVKTIKKSKNAIDYLKNQNFECGIFLGSHITGNPPLLFSKIINYKELHLIDDGTASFFINGLITTKGIYKKLRRIIIYLQILFFNKIIIENRIRLFNKIYKYYYIYNLDYKFSFQLEKINPFIIIDKIKEKDYIAFVGQPLVDHNMVEKQEYIETLTSICKKEGKITYYCHPNENWYKNIEIKDVKFTCKLMSLEEFFIKNGFPKKIIGVSSTALLNIKLINKDISVFYIKIKTNSYFIKKLFNILNNNGIKEYKV